MHNNNVLYVENPQKSEYARRIYCDAVTALSQNGFSEYEKNPDAPVLAHTLGAPLNLKISHTPTLSHEYVGRDSLCEIFRLRINALPNLPFFGLLFVPHNAKTPVPLCIACHGYLGTPELMYGMHGKNGYSGLIGKLLKRGFAVFSPQLLMWNCGFNPAKPHYETQYNRPELDRLFRKSGAAIASLEVFCILQSITALSNIRTLDLTSLSACGMSYGAYLTMRAMALDKRIKRGFFMSCFNGGDDIRFPEWQPQPGFSLLRDGEIAGMCAPRHVTVEVGQTDEIFPPAGAVREAETAKVAYLLADAAKNFNLSIWHGGHIVNPKTECAEFLRG